MLCTIRRILCFLSLKLYLIPTSHTVMNLATLLLYTVMNLAILFSGSMRETPITLFRSAFVLALFQISSMSTEV